MKVLVMGGSRFNGYHLVRELLNRGHDVTVFNRGVTPVEFPPEIRRLYGDRKDHQQMREVLGKEDFDCIQDISAYSPEDVESMVELFEGRTGHYIFASSTVVYASSDILPIKEDFPLDSGPNQGDYGKNKIICERYLVDVWRRRHFPVSVARFSMVLGPHNIVPDREQRMFTRLLKGRPILIPGDGTTVQQVGHVDDEARALRMMMLSPRTFGEIYSLTGKDYHTDSGYVDTCAQLVGVEPRKVYVPDHIMNEVAPRGALEGGRGPLIQRLNPAIHGWKRSTVLSMDKLREHIGYEPQYTFRSGMAQTYEWFQREGLIDKLNFDFSAEDALIARLAAEQGLVAAARA